jgi:hypothetical protein
MEASNATPRLRVEEPFRHLAHLSWRNVNLMTIRHPPSVPPSHRKIGDSAIDACACESGFVNHSILALRIGTKRTSAAGPVVDGQAFYVRKLRG